VWRALSPLTLRAYYKKSFRMPTFNDLYYADMGNSRLEPEHTEQWNVGLVYDSPQRHARQSSFGFTVDTYYNKVKDKIVAYPKGAQFRWTMLNLGRVEIRGLDATARATLCPTRHLTVTGKLQYTYQEAIDVTSPADTYYRHQIPYIPWHSGSAIVQVQWRQWGLNYSFIYTGERYNQQENIVYNHTQPWYTSDLSLLRDFRLWGYQMRVMAEVNNLFSQDYDVILNYPMPKRNYRFTLKVEI
jgi:outer membrane cobalamin receptor